jgi:hypothetical protein
MKTWIGIGLILSAAAVMWVAATPGKSGAG